MCNNLVTRSYNSDRKYPVYPIPEKGIGYKVFEEFKGDYYTPWKEMKVKSGRKLKWYDNYYGNGFTFFDNISDAIKLAKFKQEETNYIDYVVAKISYKGGLGKRFEPDKAIRMKVCLCKEYTMKEIVWKGDN